MTPKDPQEPFTEAYQARLKGALRITRAVIGAHYVCKNASVRVPLSSRRAGSEDVELYLLGIHPSGPDAGRTTVEHFMHLKAGCAQAQLEGDGFQFLPQGLKPSLSTTLLSTHLETKAGDSKTFQIGFEGEEVLQRVVEKANASLSDPLNPPGKGLLFEPLDAALLEHKEFSRCLIANRSGIFGFDDVKTEADRTPGLKYLRIEDRCLMRGTEAVRRADFPNERLVTSDQILACSIASIPLLGCEEDKDGVPLAAVFSWKSAGKLKSVQFHLGDVLSRSERLRSFQKRVTSGEFNNFFTVSTDQQSDFIRRFTGEEKVNGCYGLETVLNPSYYHNPDHRGKSLKEMAAGFDLTPPPARSLDDPAAVLALACAPTQAQLKTDPTLKAIFAELSWRNQAVMELSDEIVARCELAQDFSGMEHYDEVLPEITRSWLLFPAGELDRHLADERRTKSQAKELTTKTPEQGEFSL